MYISIYNIMENIQRASALQYIFSILFKTFDSCVYVTEVSFHWFLFKLRSHSLASHARESEGTSTLGKLVYIDPREKKINKVSTSNWGPFFFFQRNQHFYQLSSINIFIERYVIIDNFTYQNLLQYFIRIVNMLLKNKILHIINNN